MLRWMIVCAAGALFPGAPAWALDVGASVVISLDAKTLAWTAPVQVASDPDALGGEYVVLPAAPDGGNSGSAKVRLPSAGDYYLWGRVKAPAGAGHLFDVEIGDVRYPWPVAAPTTWHWERIVHTDRSGVTTPVILSITKPGAYTFKVLPRERGSLDEFLITNDLYLAPVDHPQR